MGWEWGFGRGSAGQHVGRPLPPQHSWSERACGPVPSRPHVLTLANISGEPLTFPYVQGGGGACVTAGLSVPCVYVHVYFGHSCALFCFSPRRGDLEKPPPEGAGDSVGG